MSEPEQQWYFISVVNGERYGPYSAEQLEGFVTSGSITRETMIWTAALQDQWIPATNVEGLFRPVENAASAHPAQPAPLAQPARPQLITGAPTGSALPLAQAAPLQAAPLQAQPLQAAPLQAQPAQPVQSAHPAQPVQLVQPAVATPAQASALQSPMAQPAPAQRVAPGMIPSTMPGIAQPAAPAGGLGQTAALAPRLTAPGSIASGEPFPSPSPTKASFGLWLGLLVSAPVVALLASVLEVSLLSFAALPLLLWAQVLGLIYLHRAWSLIQPGNVQVSPGKAIGFLFIPFFNIYWLFIAIGGLPKEWNRVMASHPNLSQAPRLSSGIAIAACLVPVIGIPLMASICKGINWLGGMQLGGSGPTSPSGSLTPGSASAQAGRGLRLY